MLRISLGVKLMVAVETNNIDFKKEWDYKVDSNDIINAYKKIADEKSSIGSIINTNLVLI